MNQNQNVSAASRNPTPEAASYYCLCCGGKSFRLRHHWPVGDHWNQCSVPLSVWDCQQCELTFLWPLPKPNEYPGGGDWFSPQMKDLSRQYGFKRWRRRMIDRWLGTKQERFLKGCVSAKPTGKFLDIGCGTGEMLELASQYYTTCEGVEPSPIAAEQARMKGFTIHEAMLDQARLPENHYDMILMDSVIEHVPDPVAALKICYNALAKDGVVGMLTPKIGGPAYRIHGPTWNGFRHGYHLFLFNGKTLAQCMKMAGFETLARPRRDRATDDILILWGRKT